MKKRLLLATAAIAISASAQAAIVYTGGSGQSFDNAQAFAIARANAAANCVAQGGTPKEEVYANATRHAMWYATVVIKCEVP